MNIFKNLFKKQSPIVDVPVQQSWVKKTTQLQPIVRLVHLILNDGSKIEFFEQGGFTFNQSSPPVATIPRLMTKDTVYSQYYSYKDHEGAIHEIHRDVIKEVISYPEFYKDEFVDVPYCILE